MDTIKVNTENVYREILLEFETLDEERYAVSISKQIQIEKILQLMSSSILNNQIDIESKHAWALSASQLDLFHLAMKEKLDIDINGKQD